MNNRFLFRGKRLEDGAFVNGLYLHEGHDMNSLKYYIQTLSEDGVTYMKYEIDPSTLGQCTDLMDRNGKMIFEGDMVYHKIENGKQTAVGVVEWYTPDYDDLYNKHCGFVIRWIDKKGDASSSLRKDIACWILRFRLPIIGNIHDNPELL